MKDLEHQQATLVAFRCTDDWYCRNKWRAVPTRIVDAPDDPIHPWHYFANCPECGKEGKQESWERSLYKAWAVGGSGPKTPEGIAAVTKNIEGHPTPEEALRTRFNGLSHGLYSRVATYFPARPGKYSHCNGCDRLNHGCGMDGLVHCVRQTELFLKHQAAFDSQDPGHLKLINADFQSAMRALADNLIRAVAADGVVLRASKFHFDAEGTMHLAEYTDDHGNKIKIEDVFAHPALKPLIELIKANNMGLADMGMTPKSQEEAQERMGHLQAQNQQTESMQAYLDSQKTALDKLSHLIERSRERAGHDPVLLEHQQSEGQSEAD